MKLKKKKEKENKSNEHRREEKQNSPQPLRQQSPSRQNFPEWLMALSILAPRRGDISGAV